MARKLMDRLQGDGRTHEAASRVDPRVIDPGKGLGNVDRGSDAVDAAPGSDEAFPRVRMPEYDFFDKVD